MLSNFFDWITRLSLRFRWVTLILTAVILAVGVYAMTGLNQEMLPRIEFPQTIIVAQWPDAEDTNQFLQEITIPLEENLSVVDGVLNVESTTNTGFAFIIARYDFGLNQERLSADMQAAVDNAGLPEGVDTQLLNISLSDLPIVVASVSSSELSLVDLKALVEAELQPRLETLEEVNQVSISGGQELPEEEAVVAEGDTAVAETALEPTPEPAAEDPGRLPTIVIEGAKGLGIDITHAQEITVEMLAGLSEQENAAEQVLAILNLLPHDVLPYLPADTMSYLPVEYTATLDPDMVAQLNETAAEYGGVGQYTAAEATTILSGAEVVEESEAPAEEEVAVETADLPEITPVELPDLWVTTAAAAGFDLIVTSDITPEIMGGIVSLSPALLNELTPEMWRAIDPAAVAVALPEVGATLDPALFNQLIALGAAAAGQAPNPAPLPSSWVAAAEYAGFTVETTADLDATAVSLIATATPELLDALTEDVILAFDPTVHAALPAEYVAALEPGLQQTLANIAIYTERNAILAAAGDGAAVAELPAMPLPESWIAGAAALGQEIADTSDITVELMQGIISFAPEQLAELTPEMWRAFDPAVTAVALTAAPDLDPDLMAQLQAMQWAATGSAPEPAPLPASWIAAAGAAGFPVETTADIPAEAMGQLAAFAPELLADLTQETLLGFNGEALAALPAEYVATLDPGLQQTVGNIIILHERFVAETAVSTGEEEAVETEPVDPGRLPDLVIQGAQAAGVELELAQDIPPDFIRQIGAFGPQGLQILQLLTPDNLRLLQPEAIALLPQAFLDGLDADLQAELDALAADFGGAGQLAVQEAEEAAALSEGAPELSGIWLEPSPEGEPSMFRTAADLLNNPFAPGAAAFLNFFPTAPNVENPAEWMSALSPETIRFLVENEADFIQNMSPIVLEMFAPETLSFMLETYPDAFAPDVAERLAGIAAGSIEVFIPEATITRTDGNPSVIVSVFKDGNANTVVVAHRIFDALDAIKADFPDLETNLVFEQATFIEDSIAGVSREGALGAVFAVLVILVFLSGQVGGKYKLSWRATLVTAVSIPLSIFSALLLMRVIPPTLGEWLQTVAQTNDNTYVTFFSRLFPTEITLNIMTLSGLTVAIGRVVDDSIVVLENSYRYIQRGMSPKEAVIQGTKEVAVAIFSATAVTMAVFLPLGLIGGIVGSFFLPFGLAVAYALAASFIVSIVVVPALTYLLITKKDIPEERETAMQRWYTPMLEWALNHRGVTMLVATLIFLSSLFLLSQLPQSFIPSIGEPTINVTVNLPNGTMMADTDEDVMTFETAVHEFDGIETIQTEIGTAGGFESFFGGGGVSQNLANITISVADQDTLTALTNDVRQEAEALFGVDNVTVSAASQAGFGGFGIILTGDSLEELRALNEDVKAALESVDADGDGIQDIANVSSNIDGVDVNGDGVSTIIRIDGRPAISFSGELETQNTLGVTNLAKTAVIDLGLPNGVEVTEGFDSEQQVEGFRSMMIAIVYAIVIAYAIMAVTFRSLIHPFTILFSIPFALVGAAIALYISNSVLGISAMIGFMMLIGVVVTNGIVLMELVQQLRQKGDEAYSALVEAGRTRLRPIWMTALTAILALIPLAFSVEDGAIIAKELARAVMGGLLVSTALTLIVVPVVYSLLNQLFSRKQS